MGCKNSKNKEEVIVSISLKQGIIYSSTGEGIENQGINRMMQSLKDVSRIHSFSDDVDQESGLSMIKEI